MIKTIVGVFAHPDDEVIASGLLYRAINCGIKVHLICATRGGAGKITNIELINSDNIKHIRTKEIEECCNILGVSTLNFLELEDGEAETWENANVENRLIEILNLINPDIVITFDSNGGNGHPDHKEISRLTSIAFERFNWNNDKKLLYITLFPETFVRKRFNLLLISKSQKEKLINKFTVKDNKVTHIVKLSRREMKKKLCLLECYKSQFPDKNGKYYKLPLSIFKYFAKYECYYLQNKKHEDKDKYQLLDKEGIFYIS